MLFEDHDIDNGRQQLSLRRPSQKCRDNQSSPGLMTQMRSIVSSSNEETCDTQDSVTDKDNTPLAISSLQVSLLDYRELQKQQELHPQIHEICADELFISNSSSGSTHRSGVTHEQPSSSSDNATREFKQESSDKPSNHLPVEETRVLSKLAELKIFKSNSFRQVNRGLLPNSIRKVKSCFIESKHVRFGEVNVQGNRHNQSFDTIDAFECDKASRHVNDLLQKLEAMKHRSNLRFDSSAALVINGEKSTLNRGAPKLPTRL